MAAEDERRRRDRAEGKKLKQVSQDPRLREMALAGARSVAILLVGKPDNEIEAAYKKWLAEIKVNP